MSTEQPRNDGSLFNTSYLLSPNKSVAESILWPIPILGQCAASNISIGDLELGPGDVLELLSDQREEYLLVVTLLDNGGIICYSTNTESYVCFEAYNYRTATAGSVVQNGQYSDFDDGSDTVLFIHAQSAYAVHSGAVSPVDDDPVASVSWVQDSPVMGDYEPSRTEGYYPYSNPPSPMSPSYPSGTYSVEADAVLGTEDVENELLEGDAIEQLKRIPDKTFHCFVTSPPYPNSQRDYEVDGQLGVEESADEYLKNILSVILQAMRVLRERGTGWIILDDSIVDGEYIGVPDRLVGQLKQEGFKIFHNGPWVKHGVKPDPAPRRFAHTHERIIGIAKSDDYIFHRRAVEDQSDVITKPTSKQSEFKPPKIEGVSHDAMFSVELAEHLITAAVPDHTCPDCGSPFIPEYTVDDILDLKENRHKERVLKAFRRTPEMTREHARACRSYGLSARKQAARTQSGTGNNSDRVEQLVNEVFESDFPKSYVTEFTYARRKLTGYEQTCNCADVEVGEDTIGGIVLDPFVGSGTTCEAAVRHDRHYTGIDLNADYLELARERLNTGVDISLDQFL